MHVYRPEIIVRALDTFLSVDADTEAMLQRQRSIWQLICFLFISLMQGRLIQILDNLTELDLLIQIDLKVPIFYIASFVTRKEP